ncbi:MAG: hypothetical protein KDI45_01000 [Candidatus Accumulibacter sp.]|nr:hypothetical protein [Accumulibacter sp.]
MPNATAHVAGITRFRKEAARETVDHPEKQPRWTPYARLGLAFLGLGLGQPAPAVPIGIGQGVDLSQVDLAFPGVLPQPASQYGLAAVDIGQVLGAAALPSGGFLNMATAQGWVVQNLPVDAAMLAAGYPGISVMFDLGTSPGRITALSVALDVSAAPLTSFAASPGTSFSVGQLELNAQGGIGPAGVNRSGPTDYRIPQMSFDPAGQTFSVWQPNHASVEQGVNQCGPASLANSFQYLEDTFGLTGSQVHADIPGVGGVPPNSRVAQFDLATMRQITGTCPGGTPAPCGVSEDQFFKGKTAYIKNNGLVSGLAVKSYGKSGGDQTVNGVFIDDQSNDGLSLVDWLLRELQHGEDVELWLDWKGGGAHLVDLIGGGKIKGTPWFSWVHDFTQGDNSKGTSYSEGGLGFSFFDDATGCWNNYVGSGQGATQIACATFRFAASESVSEPSTVALFASGLALVLLGLRARVLENRGQREEKAHPH